MNQSDTLKGSNINSETHSLTFTCDNCGGTISYNIKSKKFMCSSCRCEVTAHKLVGTVKENKFDEYYEHEKNSVPFQGLNVVRCNSCGYEIALDDEQIATICPMCNSTYVITEKQSSGITPKGIIPFKIDKDDVKQFFKKWISSRWFAPNEFKKKNSAGAFQGIYLPFWTFDTYAYATYTGQGGRNRTVRGRDGNKRIVTDWYDVDGLVSASYDDIQICASENDSGINKIMPFNTIENTKPYSHSYLSGYYAEVYTIKADAAFEKAKTTIDQKLLALAKREISSRYSNVRKVEISPEYAKVTYKHILLPIWRSSYKYKNKIYNFLVNGETGVVYGERPYSALKIIIFIATLLAITAGVILYLKKYY